MRGLVISDTHCGSKVGLTPPAWQNSETTEAGRLQRQCWEWYTTEAQRHGPYDFLICNGDAVDGNGKKSGGTEQITTDRQEQAEMAVECIKAVVTPATKIVLTYGTPYHTGSEEDFEKQVAEKVGAVKIGGHEWFDVEGWLVDCKHKVGSSSTPQGRYTPLAKEAMWNDMWVREYESHPSSDLLIRSHVHYYRGILESRFSGFTTPALQAMGGKYGTRQCSGVVNYGFVVLNITQEDCTWKPFLAKLQAQMPVVVKL